MAKYRVYADYVFTKVIAEEIEAESEEEAIERALEEAECNVTLCYHCSKDFVDGGVIDEKSCCTDLLD